MRVKICGIRSLEDALAACEAGADALGFNFYEKSPRYVELAKAAEISRKLPPFVARVGLFVNAAPSRIEEALFKMRLDWLQFHGDEGYDEVSRFPLSMAIKAVRVKEKADLKDLKAYDGCAALLLDASVGKAYGGTGKAFDWRLALDAKKKCKAPLILAGGLHADNVAEAVRTVRPWAVDVASGVESAPGKKDRAKMKAFIKAAKEA